MSGNALQSLCESDNTEPGSESSEGPNSFYLDFSSQVFEITGTLYLEINKEGLQEASMVFIPAKLIDLKWRILTVELKNS